MVIKWDISDVFHRYYLRPKDVGTLFYAVHPIPSYPDPLLYIDIVLPIEWVNSLDLFCSTSETVTGVANASFPSTVNPQKINMHQLTNYTKHNWKPHPAHHAYSMQTFIWSA